MKKQYKRTPKGCQPGAKQHRDHGMGAPGEILITNWIDREGSVRSPAHVPLKSWKGITILQERELGIAYIMRVSNCSGIKRIRAWNTNIAGTKGEKIWQKKKKAKKPKTRKTPQNHWEIEAESGAIHWVDVRRSLVLCGGQLSHPSGSQLTFVHLNMEDGNSLRIQWSMKVEKLFRPLLVKFFLTCEKNYQTGKVSKSQALFVCKSHCKG